MNYHWLGFESILSTIRYNWFSICVNSRTKYSSNYKNTYTNTHRNQRFLILIGKHKNQDPQCWYYSVVVPVYVSMWNWTKRLHSTNGAPRCAQSNQMYVENRRNNNTTSTISLIYRHTCTYERCVWHRVYRVPMRINIIQTSTFTMCVSE